MEKTLTLNDFGSEIEVKLTKKALNDFITWSTSRYNNYCGYGNKKENVDLVYESLLNGYYTSVWYKKDGTKRVEENKERVIFTICCAGGQGESGAGRYWRTKQSGDEYTINCETLTIEAKYSKRSIKFIKP